mgnify:CR=1 FL=1
MLKKAINCINPNLISIYQKTANLEQVTEKIIRHIPKELQKFVSIASYDKGILTLSYHNAAIGNELRYFLPELRTNLRCKEKMYQLVQIKSVQKR